MNPKNAIEIRNVVKSFRVEVEDPEKKAGLFNRSPRKTVENRVLDGIDMDVGKGEVLGIIGRNGSGKSTLLSIIARIMEPDSGTIERSGKIASILELGMGFHPDMSGRENIRLKGELYGFSKAEMDVKMERIIDYSGISRYIDNPVRTYSSGMSGRLAFSIMVNVESDIMLVDEVLSVGDAAFMSKAKQHFKKLAKSGKTVVFVSHSIQDMEDMCTRIAWIEDGRILMSGKPKEVCSAYKNKISESPDIIRELAEEGVPDAQYRLALLYRDGTIIGRDEEQCEKWLEKASSQGHVIAQVVYADLINGRDGESTAKAISLWQAAADKGNNDARLRLSSLNNLNARGAVIQIASKAFDEMGATGDPVMVFRQADFLLKTAWSADERKRAFELFRESADKGYPNAMHQTAIMFRDAVGTPRNIAIMEEYFEKACECGFLPSLQTYADMNLNGNIIKRDETKAFNHYRKGAELGNGRCQYQVAIMYRDGIGTEVDVESSDMWFSRYALSTLSSNLGLVEDWIMCNWGDNESLSVITEANMHNGSPKSTSIMIGCSPIGSTEGSDNAIILESMGLLASNGNVDAIRRMGNYHYDGVGVAKDYSAAASWYEKSAALGDSWSRVRLGEMYRDGKGVARDAAGAVDLFEKASMQGNVAAMSNIISMHVSGMIDDEPACRSAMSRISSLAEGGNVDAIRRMGNYHYDGVGVAKDYSAAASWYEKSAALGDSWSRVRLGEMYRDGKGVEMNKDRAQYWFMCA